MTSLAIARLVPLSSLNDEGQMIMPEFWAEIADERVFITAVLERTVVFVHGAERKLARRDACYVDPADIQMRPSSGAMTWRGRGKATPPSNLPVEEPTAKALAETEAEPAGDDDDVEVEVAL
jgi:hypothetical protein